MKFKACTKCFQEKQRCDFSADKRAKSGLQSACKACQSLARSSLSGKQRADCKAKAKAWKSENKQKVLSSQRRRREERKEEILGQARLRYSQQAEKFRSKASDYRKANLEKVKQRARNSAEEARKLLLPPYLAKVMNVRVTALDEATALLKKEQLLLRRLARELRQATKQKECQ